MWLGPIAQLLALSAVAPPVGTASSVAPQAMPEPIATRQTLFAIPFRIDRADQPWREPVEVQLFASADRGATWQLYSRVGSARRHFMFRAGGDGEYWFLVRTLDRSGQLRPETATAPRLQVVVDTTPPKLQLQAHRGEAGQLTARWQIDEPHPRLDSLTIQYRTTADRPWQPVAIGRQDRPAPGLPQTGEVTWWPQAGSGQIQIRAEVTDMAGNPAVSHAQAGLRQGTGSPPPLTAEERSSPWRAGAPGPTATPWPPQQPTSTILADRPKDLLPTDRYQTEDSGDSEDYGNEGYANGHLAHDWYPNAGSSQSLHPDLRPEAQFPVDHRETPTRPTVPIAGNVNPPIQNQYVLPHEGNADLVGIGLPPGERPRMVNSRLFELEYEVASVGPSGIARVELWATQDGGRTWRSVALDDDNRSPLLVKVDQQGVYGFKVVVTSGAGLGGKAPQSGELPEILIGVDLTKPTAQIIAAEQGTGPESGKLIISWQADDKMLAARPVSLYFSESLGGPWMSIASGLENTGRYAWPIDDRVPQGIYLCLEVRDEAGNVSVFETTKSVALDRLRPWVQIRDVRPLGQSSRTPGRYYLR